MRVLVVEDDPVLRESLIEQLEEAGFATEQAADGRVPAPSPSDGRKPFIARSGMHRVA